MYGYILQSSSASKLSALSVSKNNLVTQTRVQAGIAPSRINNRGPPRFTEIPFEAIPLEVLSSQTPGQQPIVQIQQRPFQTRIKEAKPSAVIKVRNTGFIYFENQQLLFCKHAVCDVFYFAEKASSVRDWNTSSSAFDTRIWPQTPFKHRNSND